MIILYFLRKQPRSIFEKNVVHFLQLLLKPTSIFKTACLLEMTVPNVKIIRYYTKTLSRTLSVPLFLPVYIPPCRQSSINTLSVLIQFSSISTLQDINEIGRQLSSIRRSLVQILLWSFCPCSIQNHLKLYPASFPFGLLFDINIKMTEV